MAKNLRIPEGLDRQLDDIAAAEHVSKHALILQGAELVVERHNRRRDIDAGMNYVLSHDAGLIRRLEDA